MRSLDRIHETLETFGVMETGTGRGPKRIVALGLLVGTSLGLAMVVAATLAGKRQAQDDKTFWTVNGPPCPAASPAEVHRIGRPLAQVVDFGQGHFSRISGGVICTVRTEGLMRMVKDTVCQFNAPRALAVGSDGGFAYFDVPGGPATVTVSRKAPPLCVRAANYTGE